MAKWFFAFSLFSFGLSYQISKPNYLQRKYIVFSILSVLAHTAFLPIPFVFYIINKIKKTILTPISVTIIFFIVAFVFQTEFMLRFVNLVNLFSGLSNKYNMYAENAEYWLTSVNGQDENSPYPGLSEIVFMFLILYMGYNIIQKLDWVYIFSYNIYVIGIVIMPIGNQIELVGRYMWIFYFFQSYLIGAIIYFVFVKKYFVVPRMISIIFALTCSYIVSTRYFIRPLFDNPQKYLYVWNADNLTYDYMIDMWHDEGEKSKK